jgi:hypothetical protein
MLLEKGTILSYPVIMPIRIRASNLNIEDKQSTLKESEFEEYAHLLVVSLRIFIFYLNPSQFVVVTKKFKP